MDTFELVKEFVRKELGLNDKRELLRTTRIEDDLSITGDDASEFIDAFCQTFGINADEFDFLAYFQEEGFMINFVALYRMVKGEKINRKAPLTLGDLEQAIRTKKIA